MPQPSDILHQPAVVIPAYKPSPALVDLVRTLVRAGTRRIIVVDDGGGPAFASTFDELAGIPEVTLLRHAVNLGKGAALKTAFNYALCSLGGIPGVVTADADGQHHPEDIQRVAETLAARPDSLVLGCRQFRADVPLRSRIGNIATSRIMHAVLGRKLSDTQTGLRGIPISFLPRLLHIESTGYEFELEMLLAAHHLAIPFVEEPIRTIYEDGNKSSHFNPVVDSMKIYFVLLRFGSVSLMTALLDNLIFYFARTHGVDRLPAQALGRLVGLTFNYVMVRRSVFNTRESHSKVLPKYLALAAVSGAASYGGIVLMVSHFGISDIAAKLLVETFLFFVNFTVQRLLIFKQGDSFAEPYARRDFFALLAAGAFFAALYADLHGLLTTSLFAQELWLPVGLTRLEHFAGAFLALAIPLLLMFPWAFTGFFAVLVLVLTAVSVGPLAPLAVAFFLLSTCALGSKLIGAKDDAFEDHLLATLAGTGVYIFIMAFLARVAVNTPAVWGAILVVPIALDFPHVAARLRYWAHRIRTAELRNVWERIAFALVVFLLIAHWLLALKPEISADGLAMHLAIPMNIAAHHQLTFEPARFLWAVMPMGADWCFSIVYLFGGEFAAHVLVWTLLVLLSCLLFCLLSRVSSRAISWLLIAAFLATPLVELVTGSVFVENLLASMILGLVVALWRFRETGRLRFFYLALWLGGSAMAIKIGAAAFLLPCLAFLIAETARRWKSLGRARWAMPAIGALLFAANAVPPYAIAYAKTGNPVFPFRNELYHSPLLEPGQNLRDYRFRQPLRWDTIYNLTFHTDRYYEGQAGSMGFAWLIIVPVALVGLPAVPAAASATGMIAFVAAILVMNSEPNARYGYAALPLFLVPFGALLAWMARRQIVVYRLAALFLVASTGLGIYFLSSSSYYHKDFCLRLPFSRAERGRYMKEAAPERDIFAYYNRTHPGTPILLTQESAIAGLDTEIYENHWHQASTQSQIRNAANPQELLRLLKRWNIGYLLAYKPGEGEPLQPATLAGVLERCTTPEYQQGDQYLARLDADCELARVPPVPDHPVLLLTRGAYDDLDPALILRGQWSKDSNFKEAQRQTISYSDVPGAEIAFAFQGQAVNWIFTRAYNRGIAEVFIDGKSKGRVDLYSPNIAWQSRMRYCCFHSGRHEVVIKVTGDRNPKSAGRFVDLDGIFVE